MTNRRAHKHTYDLTVNAFGDERFTCTQCGYGMSVSSSEKLLRSRSSLDAHTIRQHCTPAVLARLGVGRDGNPLNEVQ